MAITGAQLETALGGDVNLNLPQVLHELPPHGTASQYWVINGGNTYRGIQSKCVTVAANNATQQAASVVTQLLALTRG